MSVCDINLCLTNVVVWVTISKTAFRVPYDITKYALVKKMLDQ